MSCAALSFASSSAARPSDPFDELTDRDFLFFWNVFGSRKVDGIEDFAFAFGFTVLNNGSHRLSNNW
jgi:hypothetical protein